MNRRLSIETLEDRRCLATATGVGGEHDYDDDIGSPNGPAWVIIDYSANPPQAEAGPPDSNDEIQLVDVNDQVNKITFSGPRSAGSIEQLSAQQGVHHWKFDVSGGMYFDVENAINVVNSVQDTAAVLELSGNGNVTTLGYISAYASDGIAEIKLTNDVNVSVGDMYLYDKSRLNTDLSQPLNVTNQAYVDGTLVVPQLPAGAQVGSEYVVIDAGGINGTFDNLQLPALQQGMWAVTYDNNQVKAKIVPQGVTLAGLTQYYLQEDVTGDGTDDILMWWDDGAGGINTYIWIDNVQYMTYGMTQEIGTNYFRADEHPYTAYIYFDFSAGFVHLLLQDDNGSDDFYWSI